MIWIVRSTQHVVSLRFSHQKGHRHAEQRRLLHDKTNAVTADCRTWLQLGAISEDRISLMNWMVYIGELRALDFADVIDEVSYSSIAWPEKPQ
ncbi:hypothetical protein GRP89_20410 [Citrobacter freundii]|nr:tail fiber assembly protein [Citrobacter freundii]QHD92955.1 hypothetical protein GRP89_20410 [Citrobacter freundii]